MADTAERRMTVEEFFAWCDHQEGRWELVDGVPRPVFPLEQLPGEPHAMAGPTGEHQRIQNNALVLALRQLRPPCWTFTTFAVRIATDKTREPDLVSACKPLARGERETNQPLLVVEIISPSTEREDRLIKLDEYKSLPTMKEIWLISSTRRWIQVWQRREDGRWLGEDVIGSGMFQSDVLGATVALETLYEGVELDAT